MKLVAYLRVSTDQQAEHGLGLDVQRAAIETWRRTHGHRIVSWTEDAGVSGTNGLDTREGLLEALSAIRRKAADALVVYRLDRLARDLVLQEQLLRELWSMGARVFSTAPSEDAYLDPTGAADDPSRTLIRQILGAVSEYERAMIRLRMRSGKQRKAAVGGYIGGQVPYGWRNEGSDLVPDEHEQQGLSLMVALRTRGASYRQICAELEAAGHRPKQSQRWHPDNVRMILTRTEALS